MLCDPPPANEAILPQVKQGELLFQQNRPKADAHTLRSRPNANVLDHLIVLDIYNVAGINTEADNEVRSSEKSRHVRSPEDVL